MGQALCPVYAEDRSGGIGLPLPRTGACTSDDMQPYLLHVLRTENGGTGEKKGKACLYEKSHVPNYFSNGRLW